MFYPDFSCSSYFLFVALVLCGVIYWYRMENIRYWKNLGVPYLEPDWLFGNAKDEILQRSTWTEFAMKTYDAFKENGFGGVFMFMKPVVIVCNSALIEKVLMQDFDHFTDRWVAKTNEPLFQSLFHISGERWRIMRLKLGSAFSTKKVGCMFKQILMCGDSVTSEISKCLNDKKSLEIGPFGYTFATDVIASCAFGLQFGLQSDSAEGKQFKYVMDLLFVNSPWKVLSFMYKMIHPTVVKLLNLKVFISEVEMYFLHLCRSTIKYRRQNQIQRNDFLDLLLRLKEQNGDCDTFDDFDFPEEENCAKHIQHGSSVTKVTSEGEQVFTEDTIASTMLTFFIAGIRSTETTVSFALFEIARNLNVQEALRNEIDSTITKHNGWTYEAIRDMTYLDQVVQETLRLYTYSAHISRAVTQPYRIPNTDVVLEKGLLMLVPVAAIHMDPQFYPSPQEFVPERFEGNNYKSSPRFLPFGAGPRICVSIKLAVIMMKVYLARIVHRYSLKVDHGKMKLPFMFDPKQVFPSVEGGIWLEFEDLQV